MTADNLLNALESYCSFFTRRLSPKTLEGVRHRVTAWCRFSRVVSVSEFERYRAELLEQGRSTATIESVIYAVRAVAEHAGVSIPTGVRLSLPVPDPDVPTVQQIGALYRSTGGARWPVCLPLARRAIWWRAWIVVASWTGYRLADLETLSWGHVGDDAILLRASKTKRARRPDCPIPITPPVRRHLEAIRGWFGPTSVFGLRSQRKQLRNELERLAGVAGVPYACPQQFRQFAVSQWAAVDSLCGQLIHGQRLGVFSHYLAVGRHLSKFARDVQMPEEYFSDSERSSMRSQEQELLAVFRRAREDRRGLILDLARSIH